MIEKGLKNIKIDYIVILMIIDKQCKALNAMKSGKNIFITGPGGTGKSYLIKEFVKWAKKSKYRFYEDAVIITSTTGLSAVQLGGVTIHSFAGVGTGEREVDYYIKKISSNYFHKKKWLKVKSLIIDEISMMSPRLFEKLDTIARRIRKKNEPFGGIQIILSGDFCQLPTVDDNGFCFEALNWDEIIKQTFYLDHIIRQSDTKFQKCLNEIRLGKCSKETIQILKSRLNVKLKKKFGIKPTLLFSKNKAVDKYNKKKLNELVEKGNKITLFNSNTEYSKEKMSEKMRDFLTLHMEKNSAIRDELQLCIGAQVIVTVNMADMGLVNGSRGVVVRFENNGIVIRTLDNREILIMRHKWSFELNDKCYIYKYQVPLRLAWALTIHKSQGMSLDYVITDIGDSIFEYGQSYVVLSRVRSLEGLSLKDLNISKIKAHPKVIKYYESLDNNIEETKDDLSESFFSETNNFFTEEDAKKKEDVVEKVKVIEKKPVTDLEILLDMIKIDIPIEKIAEKLKTTRRGILTRLRNQFVNKFYGLEFDELIKKYDINNKEVITYLGKKLKKKPEKNINPKTKNHGKRWKNDDNKFLLDEIKYNNSVIDIAEKMGRTSGSIKKKVKALITISNEHMTLDGLIDKYEIKNNEIITYLKKYIKNSNKSISV